MKSSPPSLIGRYQVERELGQGSMGKVWLALDPILEREVAIKVVRPDLKLEADALETLTARMRQEARAVAKISHPGITALFDLGVDSKWGPFLVSERALGPTLAFALTRGRLTREGVARVARVVGDAISKAHDFGVIHRDIKPANIILTEEGPKITDFGVARLPDSTLTKAGAKVGTVAYSAPEVLQSGDHSTASDQFSFAATLYEALSGERAFRGKTTVEIAAAINSAEVAPIAAKLHLPPQVDRIFRRALHQHAAERFASTREFGEALHAVLGEPRETQPTLPERFVPQMTPTRNLRSQRAAFFSLSFLLGAAAALLLTKLQEKQAPPSEPAKQVELPAAPRPAYLGIAPQGD